jgi:PAS domain S-box-containing protein
MNPDAEWTGNPSLAEEIKTLFNHKDTPNTEQKLRSLLAQLDVLQQNFRRTSHLLGERTKELSYLYRISDLVTRENISEKDFFQELVNLVPQAWQYPEITCARIAINNEEFKTENFRKTAWVQSSKIKIKNKPAGQVEVCYFEKMPEEYEGPFLKEERSLIDSIATKAGEFIERKIIARELHESHENLRVTLQSLGDAVIATDTNGQITRMNPVAETLTGWKLSEAKNQKIEEVFHIVNSFTGQQVKNPVEKVLETGKIEGLANHTKLISKNGKEYQIADSGAPIKNDMGKVTGVVLVFRDVTEEYDVQQKLKENEERFRVIVEGAPDPIFIQSDMKFAYLNPAACRLFGVESATALLGTPVMERFHPDYHTKIKKRIKLINEDKKSVSELFEQKFLRIDGSEVWVETAGEPIIFNGKHGALVFVRNISKRKQTIEKLNHSRELLQYIVEHANSAVAVFDHEMNYIYVSRKFMEDFRVGNMDIIGKNHYDLFPELSQEVLQAHRKALQGIVTRNDRDKYIHPDESVDWARWEVRPWHAMDGSIGGIILYAEYITEQIKAEEKLLESRRMLASMVENLPGFVYRCKYDENWSMLYLSNQFEKITGYPTTNFIENAKPTFNDIIEKKFRPGIFRKWEIAVKEHTGFEAEYRIVTAEGKTRWVHERGAGVYDDDGKLMFLEGYIEDITQRKEIEKAYRKSEQKYRQIAENVSDVIWTTDLNFKIRFVSRSIERMMGETIDEHLKKSSEEKFPPETWEKLQKILHEELEKEKQPESDKNRARKIEVQHYKADGTLLWVEMNISFIRNDKGEIAGFQGVTRDISERKKAETELKQKVDELERFNRLMVGRENKMIELKKEVNELLKKLNLPPNYKVPEDME